MADSESLCNRAHAWASQGRYHEAESVYREAVRLDPGRVKAYLGLGLVLAVRIQEIPQLVNPGEVAGRTLLPSFLYAPGEVDFPAGSLLLPSLSVPRRG